MSLRDEAFERLLGAERSRQEGVRADISVMADICGLGKNDPYWGVLALIYARLPRDGQDWEALKQATERIDNAVKALGETGTKGLPDEQLKALADKLDSIQVSPPVLDHEALAESLSPQLDQLLKQRRPGLAVWLGEHVRTVIGGALASLVLVGALVVTGASGGYLAGQSDGRAQASAAAHWALSPTGRAMKRWATLNAASVSKLMQCRWGGAARRVKESGYTACYPGGSGTGYYVP